MRGPLGTGGEGGGALATGAADAELAGAAALAVIAGAAVETAGVEASGGVGCVFAAHETSAQDEATTSTTGNRTAA
jgi:hypothetical protein